MENKKVKIKDVVKLINGHPFKPTDRENSGMDIIRIQNLNNPLAIYNKTTKDVDEKYIVKKGDVLISWSASLGVYEWKNDNAYLNQHIFKVEFISDKISKDYFRYVIQLAIEELTYKMRGVGLKHLTKSQLDEYSFILPSREVQNEIISKLDMVENLITKRQNTLKLNDEYLESTFLEMFGEPILNPHGFTISEANQVYFTNGYSFKSSDFIEKGIPLLKINEVKNSLIEESKLSYVPDDYLKKYENYKISNGDLILSLTGTYGKSDYGNISIVNSNVHSVFLLNQRVAKIDFNKEVYNKMFLFFMLKNKNVKKLILSTAKGVRQANLSAKKINEIKFIAPSIELQELFSQICTKSFQIKQQSIKSLEILEELFQSLLYNSFVNKSNLTEDEIDKVIIDDLKVETIIQDIKASDFESLTQYNSAKNLLFKILERTEIKNKLETKTSKFNKGIVQIYTHNKIEIKTNREHKLDSI